MIDTGFDMLEQIFASNPGDIIYTATPGATSAMKPGDTVEIEVEGVGVLKNRIVSAGNGAR